MSECERRVVNFLEKEIKTYAALSLFLTKTGLHGHVRVGQKQLQFSPAFYKERMKEAKQLVSELRKSN